MTAEDDQHQDFVAMSNAHTAHHEAGHAIGAIITGGHVELLWFEDRDLSDSDAPVNGVTRHSSLGEGLAFTTFAGVCAGARWRVANDPEVDDFDEAMEIEWENMRGDADDPDDMSDGAIYEREVAAMKASTGGTSTGYGSRPWEARWEGIVDALWPAICDVAESMLANGSVSHAQIEDEALAFLLDDLGMETYAEFGDTTMAASSA